MGHYIKRGIRTSIPSQHVIIGVTGAPTGGNEVLHSFQACHAVAFRWEGGRMTRRRSLQFATAVGFWNWLHIYSSPQRKTVLWVHNASYALGLLQWPAYIREGQYQITSICDNDPPFFCSGSLAGNRLDIWDLSNWLPMNMQEICDLLYPMFLQERIVIDSDEHPDRKAERIAQASFIAVLGIITEVTQHDMGTLRPTAAGQAMQYYRSRTGPVIGDKVYQYHNNWQPCLDGKKRRLPLIHDNDSLRDFERTAYYGGLVLGWNYGEEKRNVTCFDVNSLYPHCMIHTLVPVKHYMSADGMSENGLRALCNSHSVVAAVKLHSTHVPFPVTVDAKNMYCTGRFWTTLATPELRLALQHKCIEKVGRVEVYQHEYMLRQHAQLCLKHRAMRKAEKDELGASIWKWIANTIWSKWAQRGERWELDTKHSPHMDWGRYASYDAVTRQATIYRVYAGSVWKSLDIRHSPSAFPAISAHIASAARVVMLDYYRIVGKENLYYTAVDSIHTNDAGAENLRKAGLVDAYQHGKLKIEGIYEWVKYMSPGWYDTSAGVVAAGLPHKHRKLPDGRYEIDRRCGIRELLSGKYWMGAPAWREVVSSPVSYSSPQVIGKTMVGQWEHFDLEADKYL